MAEMDHVALAKAVLDQHQHSQSGWSSTGGKTKPIPKTVLHPIIHSEDPKVQAVVAAHPLMRDAAYTELTDLGQHLKTALHRFENSPHVEVTRALAGNKHTPIETAYKMSEHPDMWTNAAVSHGIEGRMHSKEQWHVGANGLNNYHRKLDAMMGSHGWQRTKDDWGGHHFAHPQHANHEIVVTRPSDRAPHGEWFHRGLEADPNLNYHRDLDIAAHGWHAGHGPELEKHLKAYHGVKKESRMGRIGRLLEKVQALLDWDQVAFEPSHYDSSKTNWGSSYGEKPHDKYAREYQAHMKDRAELRKGIQQHLPFTVDAPKQGMDHKRWANPTTSKPRKIPNSYKYETYRDEKFHAKLEDWHKAATDVLHKHGFKRDAAGDSYQGSNEGPHESAGTFWKHPSGAQVTLLHHVHRGYSVNSADHPDLGKDQGHTVYWAYRSGKGRAKTSGKIDQFGAVPDKTQKPEFRRGQAQYPTKSVSRMDAAESARKKEGWQIVSHSLRALSGTMGELHSTTPKQESIEDMILRRMNEAK